MSRVALIGENSVEYINKLLDIWNSGNCAVLIDYQIPFQTAVEMMIEARVLRCYIEKKYFEQIYECMDDSIELIPYENENIYTQLVPAEVYNKFRTNYSKDEAVIIYSSGTTGKSKGIILSHFAINANADAIIDYMQPHSCIYIVKKFSHSATITGELLVALKTKTSLLISPVVVPPRYVINNISKFSVEIIGLNPWLLSMYCKECNNQKYDLSSLKKIYVSGAILNDQIYEAAHNVFYKQEIYNVYGLSETGPRIAAQRFGCCNHNSVGKAIKYVKIAIVDENGTLVPNGECGIIHVHTPYLFNGYVSGEVKHKSLYRNWFNTGDEGYFDEDGELHIVGRVDNMVVIGTHKVYPSEVERQIHMVADIQECVVTMVNLHNENILCCLYVASEKIQKNIRNVLSSTLMKNEIPRIFIRTNNIPTTLNGKVNMNDVVQTIKYELKKRKK